MNLRAVLVTAWVCAVGAAISWAQPAPGTQSHAQAANFGLAPEDAYLSPARYVNAYFGFQFDFPEVLALRPVPMPASVDRRIQLLDMVGSAAQFTALSISAYEYKNKNYTDAKTLLRRQLDQEVFGGVEQVHGLGKTTVGDRPFYYFETRKGTEQHVVLAAELSGYVLNVDLRAHNADLLHSLLAAFARAEFFPPQEAQRRAGAQTAIYQGPAISEQHLREVRESKPADQIDPGKVEGTLYLNSQIGMTYEFPAGWNIEPAGGVEPAVERYHEKVTGEPLLGPRERALVKACRRTLLSVWRSKPGADGEVAYDDFGEVTLSAMPLSCFPNIRFPSDPTNAAAVREFVLGIRFTQPLQRDMNVARTYQAGGRPFVLTHGTIAYKEQGEALARRISVALAMTQQRGYLLIWLFAAPHDAELRELMAAKVGFEADGKSVEAEVSKPGGGTAAELPRPAPEVQPAAAPQPAFPQAPFHPSLRSAGEAEPSQSGQGNPQTVNPGTPR